MTMDEVNERFPLVKYKAWMTSRAEEGLPTAGGVAVPTDNRPVSLRNADGALGVGRTSNESTNRPMTPDAKHSSDEDADSPEIHKTSIEVTPSSPQNPPPPPETTEIPPEQPAAAAAPTTAPKTTQQTTTQQTTAPLTTHVTATSSQCPAEDDLDEDDQIQMAVPTEMLANPGDSCAICIDTLEDDDDVRGLSCGHAFHASCLDPWLTSRRACCPLCKADYYVPKPRPEAEQAAEAERQDRGRRPPGSRMDAPRPPPYAFQRVGGPRLLFPGRFRPRASDDGQRPLYIFTVRLPRSQRRARQAGPTPVPVPPTVEEQEPRQETWRSRMRQFVHTPSINFPGRLRRSNNANNAASQPDSPATPMAEPTPSDLEAGRR